MTEENHLLTDPIPRLLKRLAIPVGIGFFFNTMFNVVDTFYAGLVSTEALAALSISFPVFFLIIALGAGTSTGATALIGHALGSGDEKSARHYAAQTLSFAVLNGLMLTLAGTVAARQIFILLGAQGTYLDLSVAYMTPIFVGCVFFLINYALNASLNASGDTTRFRNFLIGGFFLNFVLDPWFLFGGFGLPAFGVAGIAWATVVVQIAGNFYLYRRVRSKGILSRVVLSELMPERKAFVELARQGFPAALNMMTVAIGIFVITWFLSRFGKEAVAAYGIGARLEQMALLPVMGLNVATLALVAQNNGARQLARVKETIKRALIAGVGLIIPVAALFFFLAEDLARIFTQDPKVAAIGASYLRVAAFVFGAYMILYINVFALQGLKRPMFAIWIGLYRQLLAPVAVFSIFAFNYGWGIKGIWWGILVVTWTAAAISIVYIRFILRKLLIE